MAKLICDIRSAHHQDTSFGKHMGESWTIHGSDTLQGSFKWQRTAWRKPPSRDHLKNCSVWIGKSLDLALSPSCFFSSQTDLGAAKRWPLRTRSGLHAVKPSVVKGYGYSETTRDLIDLLQLHSFTLLSLKIGSKRSNVLLQECEEVLHQRWEDWQSKPGPGSTPGLTKSQKKPARKAKGKAKAKVSKGKKWFIESLAMWPWTFRSSTCAHTHTVDTMVFICFMLIMNMILVKHNLFSCL